MYRSARSIIGLTLALVIAMTSLSMAVARGQAVVGGEIVICTTYGTQTITLDASGTPVGPQHYCPDCALSLFAAASGAALVMPWLDAGRGIRLAPAPLGTLLAAVTLTPSARGPPVIV